MNALRSLPALKTTVRCRVGACASLRGSAAEIALWRKQPIVMGQDKLPVSFLKHSENQTVLALMAVRAALEQQDWQAHSFAEWGVIAAPTLFGRIMANQTVQRFQQEGPWGVSPNLIPHQSPHAVSGTISQALKMHGPNFGISSGNNAGPEALLLAAALLMDRSLPGLWVLLTGYDAEWVPAADGNHPPAPLGQAVALALTAATPDVGGPYLSFGQSHAAGDDLGFKLLPDFSLAPFAEELSAGRAAEGKWRLAESYWLELEAALAEPEGRP